MGYHPSVLLLCCHYDVYSWEMFLLNQKMALSLCGNFSICWFYQLKIQQEATTAVQPRTECKARRARHEHLWLSSVEASNHQLHLQLTICWLYCHSSQISSCSNTLFPALTSELNPSLWIQATILSTNPALNIDTSLTATSDNKN